MKDRKRILVSIVIPIHNTPIRLLARALKSIEEQSFPKSRFECVLVWHNCNEEYLLKALKLVEVLEHKGYIIRNIRVNDELRTPSKPRNVGLIEAEGIAVLFMDSDDTLDKNLLQISMSAMKRDKSDLVLFKMARKSEVPRFMIVHQPFPKEENKYHYCLEKDKWDVNRYMYGGMLTVTTKLYRRAFLLNEKILFDEDVSFAEDALFNVHVLNRARKISVLGLYKGYNYYYNSQSLSHEYKKSEEELIALARGFRKIYETGLSYDNNMDCLMCELMDCFSIIYLYSQENVTDFGRKDIYEILGRVVEELHTSNLEGVYPRFFMDLMRQFPQAVVSKINT